MSTKLSKEEFVTKAIAKHGNLYDYSSSTYINNASKLTIICKIHGPFEQLPKAHLRGNGCPSCNLDNRRHTLEEFINKANKVHSGKYDYSKVEYTTVHKKVTIVCKSHGEFAQKANSHLRGVGCPKCKLSLGEIFIHNYLTNNNIVFEQEKSFKECINPKTGRRLFFDFYLPEFNTLIEYDGKQHFFPKSFGSNQSEEYKKELLLDTQSRDDIKTKFAGMAGINLIRIPYTHIEKIPAILGKVTSACS